MKAKSVGGAQTPNAPEPRVESPYIDQTAKGGMSELPHRFATITNGCWHLGISRTRLYEHLAKIDQDVLVQVGGRTLVDIPRAVALIASMKRGPRKPPEPGRNRKGRAKGPSSEPEGRV
jgi:hypothetical protein